MEERIQTYYIKHGKNKNATDFSMTIWIEYCDQADLRFLEGTLFMKLCWELQKDEVFRGLTERLVRGKLQKAWGAWYCRHSQDPR